MATEDEEAAAEAAGAATTGTTGAAAVGAKNARMFRGGTITAAALPFFFPVDFADDALLDDDLDFAAVADAGETAGAEGVVEAAVAEVVVRAGAVARRITVRRNTGTTIRGCVDEEGQGALKLK